MTNGAASPGVQPGEEVNSLEIESLTGSRHDNVKRTIETLAKKSVISLPQTEGVKVHRERRTETVSTYVFVGEQGRRDSKAGSQALITPTGDCFIKQNFN